MSTITITIYPDLTTEIEKKDQSYGHTYSSWGAFIKAFRRQIAKDSTFLFKFREVDLEFIIPVDNYLIKELVDSFCQLYLNDYLDDYDLLNELVKLTPKTYLDINFVFD